jgi:hypothetical protein
MTGPFQRPLTGYLWEIYLRWLLDVETYVRLVELQDSVYVATLEGYYGA